MMRLRLVAVRLGLLTVLGLAKAEEKSSNLRRDSETAILAKQVIEEIENVADLERRNKACVSFEIFPMDDCQGTSIETISFNTWTKRGSRCQSAFNQPYVLGIRDAFCDFETGAFEETLYPFSGICERHWYDSWSIQKLSFRNGDCVGRLLLTSCESGPCDGGIEDDAKNFDVFQDAVLDNILWATTI